ncbi:MAG: cell division protein ZapA [Stomatobaculum sp.]|nr:cell division protein ZapA [Stomatobaculum sp.]
MKEIRENGIPERGDTAEVVINGKVIPVAGGETAYLQKVAAYIDGKIAALKKTRQYMRQNSDLRNVMLWLNLADDYMQAREEADRLKAEAEERETEMYALKRELVGQRLDAEAAEGKIKEAAQKLKEANARIQELESEVNELLEK